ncbi:hypothetical protein K2X40_04085 [Candidatus Babeliales bacterium]|nr:hypothetical protein [Candidatus Babeliales bacterium]
MNTNQNEFNIENSNKPVSLNGPEHMSLEQIQLVKTMIEEAEVKILQQADRRISEQLQTERISSITVFGFFASIITFLTVEFQFLKTVDSFNKIIGFTFILFALLFGFNLGLDYLVKRQPNYLFYAAVFISSLIAGLIFCCL